MRVADTGQVKLTLVRHGETGANVARLLDTGAPGANLTTAGRAQAAALVETFAGAPVDAVYASTLVRTQQTAAPLAAVRRLEVQVRPGLREISAGRLEMRGDADALDVYLSTSLAWAAGDLTAQIPGGESGAEALDRFDGVVAEAAASGARSVVMVSHGTVIRAWATSRSQVTVEFAARSRLGNTDAVVLEGSPDEGWCVLSWAGRPVPDAVVAPRVPVSAGSTPSR